jgi:hypothetical protein
LKGKRNMRSNKYPGRKRQLFASTMLILRLLFGGLQSASASSNSKTFQSGVNSKTEISRTLNQQSSMINNFNPEGSTQPELVPEDSQLLLTLGLPRGGEWQPKFGPGPRAKADARKATANRARNSKAGNSQSGISPFAQAFTVEPKFPARPGQNRDGLFGRFSARPTPDPSNPGCAGGPRSITVLSGQCNSDSSTKLTAYDGFEAKLTAKSENHLTSKHGHKFGVDDPLPRNPNQKPTKYEQTRTRLNNENKAKVREEIKSILSDTNSDIYPDVSIRGIQGRVYHSKDTNRVVGIHTEGEFAGLIMKAQPISDPQLDLLRELNILD